MAPERGEQRHGLLLLDKPKGPTSARCLEMIKRGLGQKKIGHAGTLDPMATGLLLVLLGKGTKIASYLLEGRKTYRGRLQLGLSTDTYDIEGEVVSTAPWEHLASEEVKELIVAWKDLLSQTIPPYSAVKHQGKPLYRLAREGKEMPEKVKPLRVFDAQILEMDLPWVEFRLVCGAGAYVRSLVHSLGMRLGCGAVLTELVRESSEPFSLESAHRLDDVLNEPGRFGERVIPLEATLPHWPRILLTEEQAAQVRNGKAQAARNGNGQPGHAPGSRALFIGPDSSAMALAEAEFQEGRPVWAVLRGL